MAKTYTFTCTLTSYEHYYAVGSNGVTINGGRMTVSETQEPYAVGYYNRGSTNKYSAVMVTAPAREIKGEILSITLRLNVTTNNNNGVYAGRVTDTSNLTNTGGTPWTTGSTAGWIETTITSLSYEAGCSYSLIQDSNNTGSLDMVVTQAVLVIVSDAPEGNIWVQTANGLKAGQVYVQTAIGLNPGGVYVMTESGLKQSS